MSKLKKILIGLALFVIVIFVIAIVATQGISDVAKNQLDALRKEDYIKAYAYTSVDFQKATSLDDFKKFVASYPSLRNNESSSFSTREIVNNEGTLQGTLNSRDGATTPVEYKFVKEKGEWKILSMQLKTTGASVNEEKPKTATEEKKEPTKEPEKTVTTATTGNGKIFKVLANVSTNSQGIVETNKTSYTPSVEEIFVSAYVESAEKGSKASAELEYTDSGATVGPATNTFSRDGDVITNFSFTKPTKGWPKGNYKLKVFLSNGDTKETAFQVE